MSVSTTNIYGNISISDEAIARVAAQSSIECYGIVEMYQRPIKDAFADKLANKGAFINGVKVVCMGDKISLDLYVIVKFGVSLAAVAETLKQTVKYHVENFTGMIVNCININIKGVKL
ncbi:MAG: Asp23/Gls24 family envelope stress response protein [Clostridia bacterium]|nr:Asp23/Gls24 family envelope stress response protein [Clostridia bacterium]